MLSLLLTAVVGRSGFTLATPSDADEATAERYALQNLRQYGIVELLEVEYRAWEGKCSIGGLCKDSGGNVHRFTHVYRTNTLYGIDWWVLENAVFDGEIVESLLAKENGQWYWEPLDAASR